MQPAERLWPLIREALANDTFDTLADLRRRVVRRCRWLAADQLTVQRATGFHWAVNLEEERFNAIWYHAEGDYGQDAAQDEPLCV